MKLLRFRLDDYRVLRHLEVPFVRNLNAGERDEQHTLSFLVGVNGNGKSTFLRALFEVFRRLPSNQPIAFGFELEYILDTGTGPQKIHVVNKPEYLQPETFLNDETNVRSFSQDFLPQRLVVLTTGIEDEWAKQETLLASAQEESLVDALKSINLDRLQLAIQELPGRPIQPINLAEINKDPDEQEETPFLFIRARYLPLVTLCGLLTDLAFTDKLLDKVLGEAQLESMRGFSLKFRMNSGTTSPAASAYIRELAALATRRLRLGSDYLLVFDFPTQDAGYARRILQSAMPQDTSELAKRGLAFYELLVYLYDPPAPTLPVLQDVNIFFKRSKSAPREKTPLLLLSWLSDGERSFLGRMSLFSLLGDTEALILLDEPEVHFNDYWKRQIVSIIDRVMREHSSHAVVTTHSSITLTDAKRESIFILNRNGVFTSELIQPTMRTYAADPSDIIVNIFNAPNAAGAHSVDDIQSALRNSNNKKEQQRKLIDLLSQVSPGYWSYQIRRKLAQLERELQ